MNILFAFVELLLGFVPFVAIALTIVTVLWAATKLFPRFGEIVNAVFDALFGVDEDYDRKYDTGYQTTRR